MLGDGPRGALGGSERILNSSPPTSPRSFAQNSDSDPTSPQSETPLPPGHTAAHGWLVVSPWVPWLSLSLVEDYIDMGLQTASMASYRSELRSTGVPTPIDPARSQSGCSSIDPRAVMYMLHIQLSTRNKEYMGSSSDQTISHPPLPSSSLTSEIRPKALVILGLRSA